MKVVGIEKVSKVSKKTNQPYSGTVLHCTYEKENTVGCGTSAIYISDKSAGYDTVNKVKVGDNVNFMYNRFGSVESVVIG